METWLIMVSFFVMALMRVVQKICSKKVSNNVTGKTSFRYGGYYQLLSALFSLIMLAIVGFYGFDWQTMLCAFGTAVFLAIELFTGIEALKGCSLIVSQMFSVGALFIPCILGIFLFDEPMSAWQWVGLAVFMVAMYFMVAPPKTKKEKQPLQKISLKTLLLLILGLFGSGGTMVVQKVFSVLVPGGNVAAFSFLMFAFSAVVLYVAYFLLVITQKKKAAPENLQPKQKKWKPLPKVLLICGVFLAFAVFVINMLVTELGKTVESAILFSVSYAISIVMTILVGSIYYKEKITPKNVIGILLCVGALAMINFL